MVEGHCSCGAAQYVLSRAPTFRMFCHCDTCQKVYQSAYSDITVVRLSDVESYTEDMIRFTRHQKRFAVDRGTCKVCHDPVIAKLTYVPGFAMAFLPSRTLPGVETTLSPAFHGWYHRREHDIRDGLPKISGHLRSVAACAGPFLQVRLGR